MKRTEIARIFADMDQYGGQDVTVCGWARTIRDIQRMTGAMTHCDCANKNPKGT